MSARATEEAAPSTDEAAPAAGEAPHGVARVVVEQVGTLLLALLLALVIRAVVIEPFRIPSGSMFPTLLVGDHLFVSKFAYGVRIPFTQMRTPGLREPQRGDVIVFTVAKDGLQTIPADLADPSLPREEFVKRIVGLPGDRVSFRDGTVYVNGEPFETRPVGESFEDEMGHALDVQQTHTGACTHRILDDPQAAFPFEGPIVVEPGRYFVLGDNRDHSQDSRVWGTVRKAEIRGPAFVLYWSWDFEGPWHVLLSPKTWWELVSRRMRWDRVGAPIGCAEEGAVAAGASAGPPA